MTLVPLRCSCGQARGRLELVPKSTMHVVCYCNDCRSFILALGRRDLLDEFGGSELLATAPSHLRLSSGLETLRCLRLSAQGMLRWYWSCCNTPLANTRATPGIPFVSIHRAFIDVENGESLGPTTRVQARSAIRSPPPGAELSQSPATVAKILSLLLVGRLRGEHKPNPLFVRGKPVVPPQVLQAAGN
jgi:hypothetical protein